MFGHHGNAFASNADAAPLASSPWDTSASNSSLAQDAGLNDIGSSPQGGDAQSASLFDTPDGGNDADPGNDFGDDSGGDFGGGDTA
jgi:hypothetical protein